MPQIRRDQIAADIVLLAIAGRITLGRECQEIEWALEALINEGVRKVVFDLGGLDYVDSTGIGILVTCCGKMSNAGGELHLAALQPKVAELMRIARLHQIITFYPTPAAAIADFAAPSDR